MHLVGLVGKGNADQGVEPIQDLAQRLYQTLSANGIETLYDDRPESPGVKFNDADLMGLPVRITVSERALKQGGIEFKLRSQPDKILLPCDPGDQIHGLDGIVVYIKQVINDLTAAVNQNVITMPYQD